MISNIGMLFIDCNYAESWKCDSFSQRTQNPTILHEKSQNVSVEVKNGVCIAFHSPLPSIRRVAFFSSSTALQWCIGALDFWGAFILSQFVRERKKSMMWIAFHRANICTKWIMYIYWLFRSHRITVCWQTVHREINSGNKIVVVLNVHTASPPLNKLHEIK